MTDLVEIQYTFNELSRAYENHEISKEEYKNLLEGLEIEKAVTMNAEELHKKEELNKMITAAISVVSMVA